MHGVRTRLIIVIDSDATTQAVSHTAGTSNLAGVEGFEPAKT